MRIMGKFVFIDGIKAMLAINSYFLVDIISCYFCGSFSLEVEVFENLIPQKIAHNPTIQLSKLSVLQPIKEYTGPNLRRHRLWHALYSDCKYRCQMDKSCNCLSHMKKVGAGTCFQSLIFAEGMDVLTPLSNNTRKL